MEFHVEDSWYIRKFVELTSIFCDNWSSYILEPFC
jgi:hypothetical protein